ncbi:hypothetical protein CDO52_18500 [Nocardiopsis gilva YIM 90087]|uniref:Uncharacterized protein n=1 Tax=Nocardiopsis gilva YIM 90087 TaxID=1235441 RepID=A0A223S8W1_9ACTN|nr:hypothetical protein [Nocardiopsis gilva]ASU84529.1 hypothetical protein CDO52_18500 [Nocardiopsis gilva YIM 90087]
MQRILLYNASCGFCTSVAAGVEDEAGGWLTVRDMDDPQMRELTKRAAAGFRGEEPLLLLVRDDRVTALRGMSMRLHLLKGLGSKRSWNIWKRIASSADSAAGDSRGLTRRGVLGRAAAVSASVAVLAGVRTAPAAAASTTDSEDWLARLTLGEARELTGEELQQTWRSAQGSANLRGLMGSELPDGPLSTQEAPGVAQSAELNGVTHQIAGGGELTALLRQRGDEFAVFYEARQGQDTRHRSMILQLDEAHDRLHIVGRAEQDEVLAPTSNVTLRSSCSKASDCPGACFTCQCSGISLTCMAQCCGSCLAACAGGPQACVACATLYCSPCMFLSKCCNGKACSYRPACN